MGLIITQSDPKVQALIIISCHDSKIKDFAPIALLFALVVSIDPRCSSVLTDFIRQKEREGV